MAEYTNAPVYFVHQSTPGAVDLVAGARIHGLDAFSETCPHYLTLDDTVYGTSFPEWYACCPPMRSPETVAALRDRLAAGAIHTVASDHSCYDLTQKRERSDDIRAMPHGLPGVETRMPVTFTAMMDATGGQPGWRISWKCSPPVRPGSTPCPARERSQQGTTPTSSSSIPQGTHR